MLNHDCNQIAKSNKTGLKTIQLEAVKKQTILKNNNKLSVYGRQIIFCLVQ